MLDCIVMLEYSEPAFANEDARSHSRAVAGTAQRGLPSAQSQNFLKPSGNNRVARMKLCSICA